MRTIKVIVTLLALAVPTLTLPVQAQLPEPFKISLGTGIGLPLGRFDDGFKLGWHGSAAASYALPLSPVAFQVEGGFSRFNDDQAGTNLKQNLLYGTGAVVFYIGLPGVRTVLPYLIGGGGIYYVDPAGRDGAGLESRTQFGVNVGAGLEFDVGRMNVFLESRFHDVFDGLGSQDLQFNNVTGGIRLGID
jgi:opacity protein-like surface antigen